VTASVDLSSVGIAVGHATDFDGATGITVIRRESGPMRAGVSILGRATGSRELHAASTDHLVAGRVDAIVLTGGSAYGLDATAGVMRWLEERGRGLPIGPSVVPIVPAAVVFDLAPLGRFDARPTPQMAYDACERATLVDVEEGSVGAGTGTTVGKIGGPARAMKGGFGCATETTDGGDLTVAAMVVVNAFGDIRDASGAILAGARSLGGGFADAERILRSGDIASPQKFDDLAFRNTTLAVVAVSSPVAAAQLTQLARAAGAALFRRITPCGSSFDGDIVFAVSPEEGEPWLRRGSAGDMRRGTFEPMIVEALAVSALEQAVERGVRMARGRDGIPGLADAHGD
jgi:L-aminopeptidase/D-esterase-like protein